MTEITSQEMQKILNHTKSSNYPPIPIKGCLDCSGDFVSEGKAVGIYRCKNCHRIVTIKLRRKNYES